MIFSRCKNRNFVSEDFTSSNALLCGQSSETSLPTVQPLRVVRPDAVCEVGGSTPDLSYGDLGISPGGGHPEKLVH